jgi:hypothetical protein
MRRAQNGYSVDENTIVKSQNTAFNSSYNIYY